MVVDGLTDLEFMQHLTGHRGPQSGGARQVARYPRKRFPASSVAQTLPASSVMNSHTILFGSLRVRFRWRAAASFILEVPMNSLQRQRCAGLGQTGWANFSGKLFSVEQCWPEPVIQTEIRAYVPPSAARTSIK
jgi:hypothetical protein